MKPRVRASSIRPITMLGVQTLVLLAAVAAPARMVGADVPEPAGRRCSIRFSGRALRAGLSDRRWSHRLMRAF